MKGKKTIPVLKMLERANELLENNRISQNEKRGICTMIEEILHTSGNYSGFNYTAWLKGGWEQWRKDSIDNPELSNRAYLGNEYDRMYYYSQAMQIECKKGAILLTGLKKDK